MGCDIHLEYFDEEGNEVTFSNLYEEDFYDDPFAGRNYSVFAFLAGVRNMSNIKPIFAPRGRSSDDKDGYDKGYGYDSCISDIWDQNHSHSYIYLKELVEYDYKKIINDRRSGGDTLDEEDGVKMTTAEYLGSRFFSDIGRLIESGVHKIVFSFDN